MPFLLAEILNFQGSTHLIGVGSLSKLYKVDVIDTTYDVGLIILVLFYCFVSSYVFGIKASRYAKMRVRTILRQYISLVKEKT